MLAPRVNSGRVRMIVVFATALCAASASRVIPSSGTVPLAARPVRAAAVVARSPLPLSSVVTRGGAYALRWSPDGGLIVCMTPSSWRRHTRVQRRAEEVVDAEVTSESSGGAVDVEDKEGEEAAPVKSVFDGTSESLGKIIKRRYHGKTYTVFTKNSSYKIVDYRNGQVNETGAWNLNFSMPQEAYVKMEPRLRQWWTRQKRKLWKKHGYGHTWPNGQRICWAMIKNHPFSKEFLGPKYYKNPGWTWHPSELEHKRHQKRARILERMMKQKMEKDRVKRLQELGVWTGDPSWERPSLANGRGPGVDGQNSVYGVRPLKNRPHGIGPHYSNKKERWPTDSEW